MLSAEHKVNATVYSESRSVVSDSAIPWTIHTVLGILQARILDISLLQEIFPTQGSNPGLLHCRQIHYQLSHREAQEYWSRQPIPFPAELLDPEIKPGCPALQVDSLLTELSGKP